MSDLHEDAAQPWALTPREGEVLQVILQGQSNKEAGRLLGISPRTIEVHRARIMEKTEAINGLDLARIVHEHDMHALREMVRRLIEADDEHRAQVMDEARAMLGEAHA